MEYVTSIVKKYNQLFSGIYSNANAGVYVNGYRIHLSASISIGAIALLGSLSIPSGHKTLLTVAFSKNVTVNGTLAIGGYHNGQPTKWENYMNFANTTVATDRLYNIAITDDVVTNMCVFKNSPTTISEDVDVYVQYVDLTKIYGSGNEPTTVEQFLSDYPEFNEYVEYKENGCFEKEYNTLVGRMSRNLFDISSMVSYNSDIISMSSDTITAKAKQTANIVALVYSNNFLLSAGTYTVSYKITCTNGAPSNKTPNRLYIGAQDTPSGSRSWIAIGSSYYNPNEQFVNISFTIDSPKYISLHFYFNVLSYTFSADNLLKLENIQLELGSTATEYEPYGWIEKEYNALTLRKSRNLFDISFGHNITFGDSAKYLDTRIPFMNYIDTTDWNLLRESPYIGKTMVMSFDVIPNKDFVGALLVYAYQGNGLCIFHVPQTIEIKNLSKGERRKVEYSGIVRCDEDNPNYSKGQIILYPINADDRVSGAYNIENIQLEEGTEATEYEPYGWI